MKTYGMNSRFKSLVASPFRFDRHSIWSTAGGLLFAAGIIANEQMSGSSQSPTFTKLASAATDQSPDTKADAKSAEKVSRPEPSVKKIKLNYYSASWARVFQDLADNGDMEFISDHLPAGRFSRSDKSDHTRKDAIRIVNREIEQQGFRLIEKGSFLILIETTMQRPQLPFTTPVTSVAPVATPSPQPAEIDRESPAVSGGFRVDSITASSTIANSVVNQEAPSDEDNRRQTDKRRQPSTERESVSKQSLATRKSSGLQPVQQVSYEQSDEGLNVKQIQQAIKQIEQSNGATASEAHLLRLKNVDAVILSEVLTSAYGLRPESSSQTAHSNETANVTITAIARSNSLLIVAAEADLNSILELARKLDEPVDPQTEFQVFRLRSRQSSEANELIAEFRQDRLGEKAMLIADLRSNSIIVRALPRDLDAFEAWIAKKSSQPAR